MDRKLRKINKIYNCSVGKINTEHQQASDFIPRRHHWAQHSDPAAFPPNRGGKNKTSFRLREPQAVPALISPHWAAPPPSAEPDTFHTRTTLFPVPCNWLPSNPTPKTRGCWRDTWRAPFLFFSPPLFFFVKCASGEASQDSFTHQNFLCNRFSDREHTFRALGLIRPRPSG